MDNQHATVAPRNDEATVAPLLERLRDTPNWLKESYGSWKDCVSRYDRAPFEAADEIERLRSVLSTIQRKLEDGDSDGYYDIVRDALSAP